MSGEASLMVDAFMSTRLFMVDRDRSSSSINILK